MTRSVSRLARAVVATAVATATVTAASVAGAATASAADGPTRENVRGSVTLPTEPVVECDGGVRIGLSFDVDLTVHRTFDGDALLTERLTMRYTGRFENLVTGETSTPVRGTSNTLVDLVGGTLTSSGSPRSMTMPGTGVVLHDAGRFVLDLTTGAVLVEQGPTLSEAGAEGARGVCAAMGLSGGVPLAPPDVHD